MHSQYRVRVTRNEWQGYNHARLQISVGQAYHEGDKLLAAVQWVAENFDTASVNLCDSLQRHNLVYLGYSPFEAFDKAIALGDEWLDRNSSTLSILPNLAITRWEDWKKGEAWTKALHQTKNLMENDVEFKNVVELGVEEFWIRRKERENLPADKEEPFKHASRQYLLEEVAVSMIMSINTIAEVYPGTFPKPLYYLRDRGFPAPVSTTSIAFVRKKQSVKEAA